MAGEEQAKHLKSCDAKNMIWYLKKSIREVNEVDLQRVISMPLRHHRFPIMNWFAGLPY